MTFVYESDAKIRIAKLGVKEITIFLEKVPEKHREAAYAGLKSISGFRKNEPRELKERIKKLATTLAQSTATPQRATERDWSTLGNVWASWCQYNFKGSIEEATKKYCEEKCPLGIFLKNVIGDGDCNDVAQEDINELFPFSPFSSIDDGAALLREIPLRKDLQKKLAIAKLPVELAELRGKVESLSSALHVQSKSALPSNDAEFAKWRDEVSRLLEKVGTFEKRFLVIEELSISQHKTLSQALDIVSHGSEALAKKVAANDGRVLANEKSGIEVVASVRKIEGLVKLLQKAVSEQDKERNGRKVNEVESIANHPVKLVGVEHERSQNGQGNKKIESVEGLYRALQSNYVAIGIAESSAKRLAAAVSAAAMAGQLIQFSGSLSDVVAEATVYVTSAGGGVAWNVPAGLCDGELTSSVLKLVCDSMETVHALLLRGVNKSAFDVFGYEIRRIFVNRLMGIGEQRVGLFVYATWMDGDATLPERGSMAELGPMIDSDSLSWARAKGELSRYQLKIDALEASRGLVSGECDLSEISNLVADLPLSKTELWRRAVRAAISNLSSIPALNESEASECLLLYWVFPWLAIKNTSGNDLGEFVREHFPGVHDNAILTAALDRYSET